MKSKNGMNKLGLIGIALLLAMGSLGVSYARWSDTVNIDNAAKLGILSARFEQAVSNDLNGTLDPVENGTWALSAGNIPYWTGARGQNNNTATSVTGAGTYTLTLHTVSPYAGYKGSVGCTIKNTGEIPLKIKTVTVAKTGPAGDLPAAYMNKVVLGGALDPATITVIDPGNVAIGTIRPEFAPGLPTGDYWTQVTFTINGWNLP